MLGGGGGSQGVLQQALGWLHLTNTSAIRGGQLAQAKGGSSAVKQLGQKLVADHGALEAEVEALAKARGIQLPSAGEGGASAPKPAGASGLGPLSKLKGSAFDGAFLKWLASSQSKQASQAAGLQQRANGAGDPAVAALVGKVAPLLSAHASTARQAGGVAPQRQARSTRGS